MFRDCELMCSCRRRGCRTRGSSWSVRGGVVLLLLCCCYIVFLFTAVESCVVQVRSFIFIFFRWQPLIFFVHGSFLHQCFLRSATLSQVFCWFTWCLYTDVLGCFFVVFFFKLPCAYKYLDRDSASDWLDLWVAFFRSQLKKWFGVLEVCSEALVFKKLHSCSCFSDKICTRACPRADMISVNFMSSQPVTPCRCF